MNEKGGWFDERMGLMGGEDYHFSERIRRAGFKIVWSNEAIAHETVPAHRLTKRWLLSRAFRVGTAFAFVARDLDPGFDSVIELMAISLRRGFIGAATFAAGLFVGPNPRLTGLHGLYWASGAFLGTFGYRYQEYRKPRGK